MCIGKRGYIEMIIFCAVLDVDGYALIVADVRYNAHSL